MSWDVFVQDLPAGIESVGDIPDDFVPRDLGPRAAIVQAIQRAVPSIDFTDPTWGRIEGQGYAIEINIREDDPVRSFAFHVRGGDDAAEVVAEVLAALNLRAIDPQSDTGLFSRDIRQR